MEKKGYKQLNEYDRARIEVLLNQGYTQYKIAHILGVHRSTISREVKNRGKILSRYKAEQAQRNYENNKKNCGTQSKIEKNKELFSYVVKKIKVGWSPEVIAGRLKKEIRKGIKDKNIYINHESIYQFIFDSDYGGRENLKQYLRRGKKKRTRKGKRKSKREIIPNKVSIEKRPIYIPDLRKLLK